VIHFAGLDVSKAKTNICIVDAEGFVVVEAVAPTDPAAIADVLRRAERPIKRIGLEICGQSSWLCTGLTAAGLPAVCIDPRRAHGVLKAQRNKTDQNDARGIAELMRIGAYSAVHVKSAESIRTRALLRTRAVLQAKAKDIANAVRGVLLALGLKLSRQRLGGFERCVRAQAEKEPFALQAVGPLLSAISVLIREKKAAEARLVAMARQDPICRRLMTAPGVGPLTALTYKAAVDDPARFSNSRVVGAHFGLTPRTVQSGPTVRRGGITGWGDKTVRHLLYLGAQSLFRGGVRSSWLSRWGAQVKARQGHKRAVVAVARRLAVVLHRMWRTQTDFSWEAPRGQSPAVAPPSAV